VWPSGTVNADATACIANTSNTDKMSLTFGTSALIRQVPAVLRSLQRPSSQTICRKTKIQQNIRSIHFSRTNFHGDYEWQDPKSEDEVVNITFITKDNKKVPVRGKVGDNVMYLGKRYDVDIEGACEAALACTTCHVYITNETYWDKFPAATETEEDLLDAAPFLKDNSRLGCQLVLTKEHEGLTLQLPQATRNFYVDGHKPSHH